MNSTLRTTVAVIALSGLAACGNTSRYANGVSPIGSAFQSGGYAGEQCSPYCSTPLLWMPHDEFVRAFPGRVSVHLTAWSTPAGSQVDGRGTPNPVCNLSLPATGGPVSRKLHEATYVVELSHCNELIDSPLETHFYDPNVPSSAHETETPVGNYHDATWVKYQPKGWRWPFQDYAKAADLTTWQEVDVHRMYVAEGGPQVEGTN